jgi:hypothetical protein
MATSKSSTVGYASGDDQDTIEANRVYREALAKLTESLDTRKNRFFDPVMLAAAQGFAAPTQTGGFGESFGNAAKSIGAAQELESKKDQEIAQQRVNVAGQGVELQRMKARDADIAKFLTGDQPAVPKGPLSGPTSVAAAGPLSAPASPPAAPVTPPVGALTQAAKPAPVAPAAPDQVLQPVPTVAPEIPVKPRGALTTSDVPEGIRVMPGNSSYMSQKEYVALNRNDKTKSMAELLAKGAEMEHQRYAKTEAGTTDYKTGIFYPATTGRYVDVPILGEGYSGATFKIPETVAMQLFNLAQQNNFEGYKALADKFTGKSFGQTGKLPLSNEAKAIEEERKKALAQADTAAEIESRKDFTQRSKDASESLAIANVMRSFTNDPNFKKMTGILSNSKVSSGLALLVRDGIGSRNFSIGIPAIEEVMRNANLSPEEQATYRTFLMYTAQMQLNAEKSMKGSTTDRERLILGNANISPQDTAETVRRKADLLTTKAQFDRKAARAFNAVKRKMTAEEFLESDEYMNMYDKYYEDISSIANGIKSYQSPAPAAPAAAAPPAASAAPAAAPAAVRPAAPIRAKAPGAGQPSAGFIRDPKTGVIRRKKEGE